MRIFISYRRADSQYATHQLASALRRAFGTSSVFVDVDAIPKGADYRDVMRSAVAEADVVLVVIGDAWLTVPGAQGTPRIFDEDDAVRTEIADALALGKTIVPILVDQAPMPTADQLPPSIAALAFRNASPMRAGEDLHVHMDRIVRSLGGEPVETAVLVRAVPRATATRWLGLVALGVVGAIGAVWWAVAPRALAVREAEATVVTDPGGSPTIEVVTALSTDSPDASVLLKVRTDRGPHFHQVSMAWDPDRGWVGRFPTSWEAIDGGFSWVVLATGPDGASAQIGTVDQPRTGTATMPTLPDPEGPGWALPGDPEAFMVFTPSHRPSEGRPPAEGTPPFQAIVAGLEMSTVERQTADGIQLARRVRVDGAVAVDLGLAGAASWSMAVGDWTGDGRLDLLVASIRSDALALDLWVDDGTGRFGRIPAGSVPMPPTAIVVGVALADLDNDGDLDGVVGLFGRRGVVQVLNDWPHALPRVAQENPEMPATLIDLDLGVLDDDQHADLVFVTRDESVVRARRGRGNGRFGEERTWTLSGPNRLYDVFLADVEGDVHAEVVASGRRIGREHEHAMEVIVLDAALTPSARLVDCWSWGGWDVSQDDVHWPGVTPPTTSLIGVTVAHVDDHLGRDGQPGALLEHEMTRPPGAASCRRGVAPSPLQGTPPDAKTFRFRDVLGEDPSWPPGFDVHAPVWTPSPDTARPSRR